ncbi:MAG: hypothetical protein LIR10_06645 [Bacillota bacterium]|nr:hypothetical protein [Bacillota bacterium]
MVDRESLLKSYGFKVNESGTYIFKEKMGSVGGPVFLVIAAFKDSNVVKVMLLDSKDKKPKFAKYMGSYDIPFEKVINLRLRQLEPIIGKWMCVRRFNTGNIKFILK